MSSNLKLLEEYKAGNESSKEDIVKANLSLVWSLVHRFSNSSYDKEDLFQIGCLGLVKAIDKFDFSYETQFSTYAVPIILGEIKRHFRDDGAIKVSRSIKELNIKITKARQELSNLNGKDPSIEELEKYLGVNKEDIFLAMESGYYPSSLSEPLYQKDGSKLYLENKIGMEEDISIIDKITLQEALRSLSEKERLLITMRYYKNMNQSEIAQRFHISQVQVSRLEKKIIEKLKKKF